LLTGGALRARQQAVALSLEPSGESIVIPEMDATELAKRLRQAEAALRRVRSRRAVRWTNKLRWIHSRVTGLPGELLSGSRQSPRRSNGGPPERPLHG
jgi:hypothetical protein